MVINPSQVTAGMILTAYDDGGAMITYRYDTIPPGGKLCGTVKDLFPWCHTRIRSMAIVADRDVGGIVAYGNSGGSDLLTGQVLE